ncbi:MAG: hypothetical protein ISP71_01200 [Flavobacteriales bacterium]|nr:hypothetical protein [Flavobacteriales bacterium]
MKKIYFIIIVSAVIVYLTKDESDNSKNKTEEAITEQKLENTIVKKKKNNKPKLNDEEKFEIVFEEFKSLYYQLVEFKDEDDFKTYGLGNGGPYNDWLIKLYVLKNNPASDLLIKKRIVVGDLEQLALAYVDSKGQENEITRNFSQIFSQAFSSDNQVVVDEQKPTPQTESNLFGKWTIINTSANFSYTYEIHVSNGEYKGIIPDFNNKIERLEKIGNKYFVIGSKDGEYYVIDDEMNMTLYDNKGSLSTMGYKAVKK